MISVLAAGEKLIPNPYTPGSPEYDRFDPYFKDPIEGDAYMHLKQFSPVRTAQLPVEVVGVSSDSSFNSAAKRMLAKSNARFQGSDPNSLETFRRFVTGMASSLERGITAFQSTGRFKELMYQTHVSSVLPLIKVEILVESEDAETDSIELGIPTWSSNEKDGSQDQWIEDGRRAVHREQWQALTNRLRGGVVQLFINSCKSGAVAAEFEKASDDNGCSSCFLASTNRDQKDYSGGEFIATFNSAMSDLGAKLQTPNTNYWPGASGIVEMIPLLYRKHSGMIFPFPNVNVKADPYEYIKTTTPRNPLASFIYTSADALAEEAFTTVGGISNPSDADLSYEGVIKLTKSSNFKDVAKGDYYAQTTAELSAKSPAGKAL